MKLLSQIRETIFDNARCCNDGIKFIFITNNDSNTNSNFTADIEELYFESNQNDIINLTLMKIKLQYIIIAILVATNIYFIIDGKVKSYGSDNSEFKRE